MREQKWNSSLGLTNKQYNVLLCVEVGDPLPDEALPILEELHFLNLVDKMCSPPVITWLGLFRLDSYELSTTIAEVKQQEREVE